MPLYEYHCTTCDETIEVLQRSGEEDRRRCGEDCARDWTPDAGEGSVVRQVALTGGYAMGKPRTTQVAGNCGSCGMTPGSCD